MCKICDEDVHLGSVDGNTPWGSSDIEINLDQTSHGGGKFQKLHLWFLDRILGYHHFMILLVSRHYSAPMG